MRTRRTYLFMTCSKIKGRRAGEAQRNPPFVRGRRGGLPLLPANITRPTLSGYLLHLSLFRPCDVVEAGLGVFSGKCLTGAGSGRSRGDDRPAQADPLVDLLVDPTVGMKPAA